MGVSLPSLLDFIEATGPTILTDPKNLVNDAARQTYTFWRFLKGKPLSEVLQGGSEIRDDLMLSDSGTFSAYQTGDVFSYPTSQILTRWKVNWRFSKDHMAWHDQEVLLNSHAGMSESAVFQQYKDFWDKLQRNMWSSVYRGLDDQLFAVPDNAGMEADDGKIPYGLFAFINDHPNTLFTLGPSGSFTTVEKIDPTASGKQRWRNQVFGYERDNAWIPNADPGVNAVTPRTIIEALDDAMEDVRFIPPEGAKQQYFESGLLDAQLFITSKKGKNEIVRLGRRTSDAFLSMRDDTHVPNPRYAGYDILRSVPMDTGAYYRNAAGTALVTEGDTNAAGRGPRVLVVNGNYIKGVFHSLRYFHMTDVLTPYDQPFSHSKVVDIWHNTVCRSRMRQAIVTPGTVAGVFPSQVLTPTLVYPAF